MNIAKAILRSAVLSALVCAPVGLEAQVLFNTGQNVSTIGGVLRDNAWTVQATPLGGGAVAAFVVNNPPGSWEPNNTTVSPFYRYIGAASNGSVGSSQSYLYRTTFDLTGYQLSSVSFSFRCAKDNAGTTIRLNSVSVFTGSVCNSDNVYTFGNVATLSSGFVQGVNSLTFETTGDGNTDGLLVAFSDFRGTVGVSTVPEPSSAALFGAGALLVGVAARRRRVLK